MYRWDYVIGPVLSDGRSREDVLGDLVSRLGPVREETEYHWINPEDYRKGRSSESVLVFLKFLQGHRNFSVFLGRGCWGLLGNLLNDCGDTGLELLRTQSVLNRLVFSWIIMEGGPFIYGGSTDLRSFH